MSKNLLLEVLESEHRPGLRALRIVEAPIALAPGNYAVQVRRWGVGDPVIVGNSDGLSFGLKIGADTLIAASGKLLSARRVDFQVNAEPQSMTLAAGQELELAMALVQDRGKKPALLKTIIDKAVGKLPAADKEALLAIALTAGVNAAFGAAVASVLFVKLASTVIDSLFGKHALIKVDEGVIRGAAEGARGCTLCFAQVPDYSNINVGYKPSVARDFGVRAEDMMLYETVRGRFNYPESHTFPRWSRSTEAYVVVDIEWIG